MCGLHDSTPTPPETPSAFTRREFLNTGLMLASASVAVPAFLQQSALALPAQSSALSSLPGVPQDRVLVVVQLSGGNDGLNTVVPFRHDAYYRLRPGINIPVPQVLQLGKRDDVGLHPAMEGLKSLYDDGMLSIVQGVGYPNPNRSHFKSMDIWHTADTSGTGDGWIGRYIDNQCSGTGGPADDPPPQPMIALGRTAPLAMQGRTVKPIAFESADLFRWIGKDVDGTLEQPYEALAERDPIAEYEPGSNSSFLLRTSVNARISSDLIRQAVARRSLTDYPGTPLARQLGMIASMIRAGLPTRVYYASLGGFDTHAQQGNVNGSQANLLRQFADALRAFYTDLRAQGNDGRVLTMAFSEFGRRAGQNASGGTDHGTAAPMFLMGPMVRPGLVGDQPSLTNLDEGDLRFGLDFRSVYAGVIEDWMQGDSRAVLGQAYRPAKIIRA